jgi:hypothetical protein
VPADKAADIRGSAEVLGHPMARVAPLSLKSLPHTSPVDWVNWSTYTPDTGAVNEK